MMVFCAELKFDTNHMKIRKNDLSFSSALPSWQLKIYATNGNLAKRSCHLIFDPLHVTEISPMVVKA